MTERRNRRGLRGMAFHAPPPIVAAPPLELMRVRSPEEIAADLATIQKIETERALERQERGN